MGRGEGGRRGAALARNAVVVSFAVVVVVVVVAFTVLDKPATTTTFMLDAGSHPAATVYSIAQTVYLGVALGATGFICVLRLREARTTTDLVGLWVLVLGGVLGVVRMVVVVVMDVAHVAGDLDVTHALSLPYDVTTPGAVLCVASGMLLLVVGHRISRRRRAASWTMRCAAWRRCTTGSVWTTPTRRPTTPRPGSVAASSRSTTASGVHGRH